MSHNNKQMQQFNAFMAFMAMGKKAINNGSVASDLSSERGQRKSRKPMYLAMRTNFGGLKLTLEITKNVLIRAGIVNVPDIDSLRKVYKSNVLAPLKTRIESIHSDKFLVLEKLEAVLPALRKQLTDEELQFYQAFSSIVCDALNLRFEGDEAVYYVFDLIARGPVLARHRAQMDASKHAAAKQNKKLSAGGR